MQPVEQAIFATLENEHAAGYQIVAKSPGVCDDDARELTVWGPTHDSMLDADSNAESLNFHPLPSGAYCVSRTSSTGWNRNAAKQQVSTRCLVVPPDVLARFGNNPIALANAAARDDAWKTGETHGPVLESFLLTGGAPPGDLALLGQLAVDPGAESMATLVQAAREAACLAVSGTPSPMRLIEGLFSCLPPECRLEFSFSTGLKFSPRRPFRIVALSGDLAEQQWIANYPNVVVVDVRDNHLPRAMFIDGWSQLIERTLATGHVAFLAAQTSRRRFHLTLDDLPALGLQLLEELDAAELCKPVNDERTVEDATLDDGMSHRQQAHAAHYQFNKSGIAALPTLSASNAAPSIGLDPNSPEVLKKLEELDDLVYEAISGRPDTMEQLREAWPKLVEEMGETLLAESREQYLRYALSIWDECTDANGVRNPARVVQALDVLCLLFGDAT